ncbi:MAG: hypothetical protein LM514_00520 [Streptococcus sp.]|jgi:hypothetical protein|nr:hypothetical protein [Streptococcus sp.]
MQVIEFNSIVKNQSIPVPESVTLDSGLLVRVVVLFDEPDKSSLTTCTDPEIARFFGCLPDFPDRESQGDYSNPRQVVNFSNHPLPALTRSPLPQAGEGLGGEGGFNQQRN